MKALIYKIISELEVPVNFNELKIGDAFRFPYENKKRIILQISGNNAYAPKIDENTIGHDSYTAPVFYMGNQKVLI